MSEIINVDYNVHNLFPTPIHCLQINDFDTKKQALIDYAYNLRDNVWLELVSQNPKPYMIPSLIILVLFGIVYLAS